MKQNTYEIEKNIEKILRDTPTGFLTPNIVNKITNKLKKNTYQKYIPYEDAEKICLYKNNTPKIKLLKITSPLSLKHQTILGCLFSLNITSESFGDIINNNNSFYIYTLDNITDLIKNELPTKIYPLNIEEIDINYLKDYKKNYQEIKIITSSLRIDTICSKLINTNRNNIQTLIKNNNILLNNEIIKKNEQLLKINDTFSIKKYGKYRFKEIIGQTKKENYIIIIQKYI